MKRRIRVFLVVVVALLLPVLAACNETDRNQVSQLAEIEGTTEEDPVVEGAVVETEVAEIGIPEITEEDSPEAEEATEEPAAETSEGTQDPLAETEEAPAEDASVIFAVDCRTGEPLESHPFSGLNPAFFTDGDVLVLEFDSGSLPEGTSLLTSISFSGPGLPLTEPSPEFVFGGENFGISSVIQDGEEQSSAAVLATETGEFVRLSSTVEVRLVNGDITQIRLNGRDIPASEESVRAIFAIYEEEICAAMGDPAVNDAYLQASEIDPTVAAFLAERDGIPVCNVEQNACLFVPEDLPFTRTGDLTFDVTIGGVVYTIQFDVTAGTADLRQAEYSNAGWELLNASTYQAPQLTWEIVELFANGEGRGLLATSANGSLDNPAAFAVSLIGQQPITDAAFEQLVDDLEDILASYRSGQEQSP